jgi:RimJ/RimL family protein N-acetyltransferase
VNPTWPSLPTITTARCRLEPLHPDHAETMVDALADPALYEFTGGAPPTLEELRRRYRAQSEGHSADGRQWWCNWIVVPLGQALPAGYVQATVERSGEDLDATCAWVIRPEQQGRGLATEAATGMAIWLARHGVTRLAACIHPEHAASARVAGHLGLRPTTGMEDGEVRWESQR